jgi:hypothetical protein
MRLALTAALTAALLVPAAAAAAPPQVAGCQVFPASNVWNKPVGAFPKHKRSAKIVKAIGAGKYLHADFGSVEWDGGPIGIPITVVDSSQPTSSVDFLYDDESDPGPYPTRPTSRSRAGPAPTATGTRSSSSGIPARSTNCSTCGRRPGKRAPGRSGISTRTLSGRVAGPRRTPRDCRSCPGSRATTRWQAAPSSMLSASQWSVRDGRTSTPPGTSPRARPTAISRPWVFASACARASGCRASPTRRA